MCLPLHCIRVSHPASICVNIEDGEQVCNCVLRVSRSQTKPISQEQRRGCVRRSVGRRLEGDLRIIEAAVSFCRKSVRGHSTITVGELRGFHQENAESACVYLEVPRKKKNCLERGKFHRSSFGLDSRLHAHERTPDSVGVMNHGSLKALQARRSTENRNFFYRF